MKNLRHENPIEWESASRRQPNSRESRTPEIVNKFQEKQIVELGLRRKSLVDLYESFK